jgi:hypothetical protein
MFGMMTLGEATNCHGCDPAAKKDGDMEELEKMLNMLERCDKQRHFCWNFVRGDVSRRS